MKFHAQATLFTLGRPLGPIYSMAMKLRALLYRRNILQKEELDVPVISVGNLTMGGSGKTPMVIYLARLLRKNGWQPAIVSRGYHGTSKNPVNIVSDGLNILMEADKAGDEPYMIARTLDDAVVATGKKRAQVSQEVVDHFACNAIILDDGFQHLSLVRDIDLVLFDVAHFAGNSRVFPGGDLREPVSALKRCSAFIITGVSDNWTDRAEKCSSLLKKLFPDKPVFCAIPVYAGFTKHTYSGTSAVRVKVGKDDVPSDLFGFSGIAQPERFYQMIEATGIDLLGRKLFRDHHRYTAADLGTLSELAGQCAASGFLTTEKDMVKLADWLHVSPLPFYVPTLEYSPDQDLDAYILEHLS